MATQSAVSLGNHIESHSPWGFLGHFMYISRCVECGYISTKIIVKKGQLKRNETEEIHRLDHPSLLTSEHSAVEKINHLLLGNSESDLLIIWQYYYIVVTLYSVLRCIMIQVKIKCMNVKRCNDCTNQILYCCIS